MTEHDDMNTDEAIKSAWSDTAVSPELKASTMAAIRAAREAEGETRAPQNVGEGAGTSAAQAPAVTVIHGGGASAQPKRHKHGHRLVAGLVAAALCLTFAGIGGNAIYHTETAYAQVSAQTSVTLGVNRFGNVVRATASATDMQDEIDSLSLKGMSYEAAMTALAQSGYLGSDNVDVQVGANASDQEQTLVSTASTCLENAGCSGTCNGQGYGKRDGSGSGKGNGSGSGMGNGSGSGSCSTSSGTGSGSGNGKRYGQSS